MARTAAYGGITWRKGLLTTACWRIMTGMNRRSRKLGIIAIPLLLIWALVIGADSQSFSEELAKGDSVLGERIAEGIVFDGRLWLRGTMGKNPLGDRSGALVSLNLENQSRRVDFEQGVLDVERSDRNLCVLRRLHARGREFVVSVWRKDAFKDLTQFEASGDDEPLALLNTAGGPAVLSTRTVRILATDTRAESLIELKGKLRSGVQIAAASPADGGSIYVGFNRGEWGGGLQLVDLRSGVVANVERRDTKELCTGPLNSDCDPVTGIIPDSQNKDCVVAAVGLVHLGFSEGRILRVCGQRVSLVAELALPTDKKDAFRQTEAFYGIAPAGDGGFWAITWRALYRFSANGNKEKEYSLPKLEPVSGVYLSRELPGAIVLRTDVNWAVSTSGYTPLIVPSDDAQR